MTFDIEGDALWTAQPCEKLFHFAGRRNPIDRIETRRRGAVHIKIIIETERQMIGGDTRLEGREHKNLFARADFENASAAVADIQIAFLVERNARSDAHSFRK